MSEKSFEERIADAVVEQLSNGMLEELVAKKLESAVTKVLEDLFYWNGAGRKILENKFEEVIVPALENYDFGDYTAKLDCCLTEIIEHTNLTDNKKILSNFRGLMKEPEIQSIKLSEIFDKYCKYVAEYVDTSKLEINTDDEPTYQNVNVNARTSETGYTGSFKTVEFTCEEDSSLTVVLLLSNRGTDTDDYRISKPRECLDITSLKSLSGFEIFLLNLHRGSVKIELDIDDDEREIEVIDTPEATYV
jgi:hypothetical protein